MDPIEAFEQLVATVQGVERKGDRMPYTSLNGNMYSYLDAGTLALRLSSADRSAFIERYGAVLRESHGHVMKEYVRVPAPMLDDLAALEPWFAASHAYAMTLKPKPTTRRKASS